MVFPRTSFAPRQPFRWNLGHKVVELGQRTLVMGVLNVTPDSFSDGGDFLRPEAAVAHGLQMLHDGADILDIGGESTRPGSTPLTAEQELARILPVISQLRDAAPDALLSIDTNKAEVAKAATAAGADIVNDVSGFTWDIGMATQCAALDCGVVLMHTRGRPQEWKSQAMLPNEEVVKLVMDGLQRSAAVALDAGIARERIVLDPGFGFGKRGAENYALLHDFSAFAELGFPLLAGASRKSFLGHSLAEVDRRLNITSARSAADRDTATLAATVAAILGGAHIVRVHNVSPAVEAAQVADEIFNGR